MPIEETPLEQEVVAVALKLTGEPTVLLPAGELTETPVDPLTVIVMGVVDAPPHLSHSSTTVSYLPGLRLRLVLRLVPLTTYTRIPGQAWNRMSRSSDHNSRGGLVGSSSARNS